MAAKKYNLTSARFYHLSVWFWFFVSVLLLIISFFVLNYVGLIRIGDPFANVFVWLGLREEKTLFSQDIEDPLLLEKERFSKREFALVLRQQELTQHEVELAQKRLEIDQLMNSLQEREQAQTQREQMFSEQLQTYQDQKENLRQTAQYLSSMPPEAAVERLSLMDEVLAIEYLREVEAQALQQGTTSVVPYWLSLMSSEKAASLLRKMQLSY